MFADGRIPLWIVATVAGMGAIAVVGVLFLWCLCWCWLCNVEHEIIKLHLLK